MNNSPDPSGNGQLNNLEFLKASLARLQTNIFLTDAKLNIVYANDRALPRAFVAEP